MDDRKVPAATAKPQPEKKPGVSPGEFMRQVRVEASKVVWPTRQETISTSIFVAILMFILAVFFLGIDSLFGYVVRTLLSLA
ncbi:preprotein translocase subunit SecE [Novosphingobium sp. FSY-8]|uniref:Protein translocase subunit SecE n=2 Tax=Novosphingobium ovatum TaxID=1908523 RepID=A0ABW9X949_9SPHN|nr:preprotein translocase subunit SecE [Novosphingobium ovatum]